jgi:O-antigen/teichoic acid export membrane protein
LAVGLSIVLGLDAGRIAALLIRSGDRAAASEALRVFAVALPAAVAGDVLLGAIRGLGGMVVGAALDLILKPFARLALVAMILNWSGSVAFVATGWAVPVALTCVFGALWLYRTSTKAAADSKACSPATRTLASEFWRLALPQSLAAVFQVAVLWADILMLGALKSSSAAGIYSALTRYLTVGTLGLSAVALAVAPLMSRLLDGDTTESLLRAERVYRLATVWVVMTAAPLYVLIALFAPVLLRLFGESFVSGGSALAILAVAMFANIATGPVTMVLLMGGRSGVVLLDSSVAFAMNIGLNAILIPRFGMTGAACAWAVGIVAMNGLAAYQVFRRWHIHPFSGTFAVVCGTAVFAYGCAGATAIVWLGATLPALVLSVVGGTVVYVLVIRRQREELELPTLFQGFVPARAIVAEAG